MHLTTALNKERNRFDTSNLGVMRFLRKKRISYFIIERFDDHLYSLVVFDVNINYE